MVKIFVVSPADRVGAGSALDLARFWPNLSGVGSEVFPRIFLSVKELYLYAATGS